MKGLIERGHLFIAQPPLYSLKKVRECATPTAMPSATRCSPRSARTARASTCALQGLGEMNPEQLWETTMNPSNRTVRKVTLEDAVEAESTFTILMAKVEPRRKFIEDNAHEVENLDVYTRAASGPRNPTPRVPRPRSKSLRG